MTGTERVLVSACLLGIRCAYDGRPRFYRRLHQKLRGRAVPCCPEQLGGLSTPRLPAEISGGTGGDVLDGQAAVLSSGGDDCCSQYRRGAWEAVKLARQLGVGRAVLRPRSPACGPYCHYDGSFSRNLVKGEGVAAAALRRAGVQVYAPAEFLTDEAER